VSATPEEIAAALSAIRDAHRPYRAKQAKPEDNITEADTEQRIDGSRRDMAIRTGVKPEGGVTRPSALSSRAQFNAPLRPSSDTVRTVR
jgi:hypothetical protein